MKSCESAVARLGRGAHNAFRYESSRQLTSSAVQRQSARAGINVYASAGNKQKKAGKRLQAQADRLKQLSGQLGDGSGEPIRLSAVVAELAELNAVMSEVRCIHMPPASRPSVPATRGVVLGHPAAPSQ